MIQDKVLLITGASSDIGCELIKSVEKKYSKIYAHYYKSDERLKTLKADIGDKLHLVQADFTKIDSVFQMIEEIKIDGIEVNHIVHLASAKIHNVKFLKTDWKEYQKEMYSSTFAIVEILKAFLHGMVKNRYGRIIFMLTACTQNIPPKYLSPYVTAKYAALGLMKSLSAEYSNKGITVNGISPEMIETRFLSEISELIIEKNALENPLGRNLTVYDVVPMLEYLLSDAAEAINGQNIVISGGK